MRQILIALLLVATLVEASYTISKGKRAKSSIDRLPFHSVADMKRIPQKTSYYAKQIKSISWAKQRQYDKAYNRRYFSPWKKSKMGVPVDQMTWQVRFVRKKTIYNRRSKAIPKRTLESWITNSNLENVDKVHTRAISVKHTNLRAFPTTAGAYRDPWKSTEGFPFDYNQNSELHINTPLYISHYSRDRRWAFVNAGHAFGWVKFSDVALVNHAFMMNFQTGKYAISTTDDLMLQNGKKVVSIIKLGTIFPMTSNKRFLIVAEKNRNSYAVARRVKRPSSTLVTQKPVKFNRKNVARISQEFYNEPYGWGGKLGTRDCSATTRDFFGCFGIYMERNSAKQAKVGRAINIRGMKKDAKKRAIIQKAKPFLSMLYVKGHIGIYIGQYRGEPVIMHTYWGVRLKDWNKYTLARTIITTTEPGKELPNIREKSKLINTLQKIINF